MASNSGWSKEVPSGSSAVAKGDDEIRSFKSFMEAWWEQEHYGTDGSASSAGVHKAGSARIYSQSAAPSPVAPVGQLWHDTDDDKLYVNNGSWILVSANVQVSSQNTWTALQEFTSDISTSDIAIGGAFTGIASWTSALAAKQGVGAGGNVNLTFKQTAGLNPGDVVLSNFTYNDASGTQRITWSSYVEPSNSSVVLTLSGDAASASTASIDLGNTIRFLAFNTS